MQPFDLLSTIWNMQPFDSISSIWYAPPPRKPEARKTALDRIYRILVLDRGERGRFKNNDSCHYLYQQIGMYKCVHENKQIFLSRYLTLVHHSSPPAGHSKRYKNSRSCKICGHIKLMPPVLWPHKCQSWCHLQPSSLALQHVLPDRSAQCRMIAVHLPWPVTCVKKGADGSVWEIFRLRDA